MSFLVIILFSSIAIAQLQYSVNTVVDERGKSLVKLIITFPEPEKTFDFTIKGNVDKFNASSNAGPALCELKNGLITSVNCVLNLTKEKRTIYIDYGTSSFVKISDRHYFDGDFSLGKAIDSMVVSVTLPEGMVPVKDIEGTFPPNATASWDLSGRKLTMTWPLSNLAADRLLRFQVLYENIQPSITILWYIPLAIAAVASAAFVIVRRMKKSREVVLSVLDGFERKVMDVIIASGGAANQRKVVQETNLSKAKVSRVVKSLAERGLIDVERLGRTNKLKAKKKMFE